MLFEEAKYSVTGVHPQSWSACKLYVAAQVRHTLELEQVRQLVGQAWQSRLLSVYSFDVHAQTPLVSVYVLWHEVASPVESAQAASNYAHD